MRFELVARVLAAGSGNCPYCNAPLVLPDALRHELELYRRRMRAHDVLVELDPALLRSHWQRAAHRSLACVVCGAPRAHTPGVVDEACAYCGASMIPPADLLEDDVDLARERRLRADAVREERVRAGERWMNSWTLNRVT